MVSFCKMREFLILLVAVVALAGAAALRPTCSKPVYCESELLHRVQMARLFNDSKTFVDLQMNYDQNQTLRDFETLLNDTNQDPSREQLREFVDKYFSDEGELEEWTPPDFSNDPKFIYTIKDKALREFAKNINDIWPLLARKVKDEVIQNPDRYSLVPITHGFIIPGGRFTEIYYWDTFWIIEGLLISGMQETAKGIIENLIELLNLFGHIPNGSRWYYQERSQPPMLTAMVATYYQYTNDTEFLKNNIAYLEKEMDFWLDERSVSVEKEGSSHKLLRYFALSSGPRPESYYEDYENAVDFDEERRTDFYVDIKSAAESGWDFSTRWFVSNDGSNNGTLRDIHTRYVVPADLNAIFAGALQNVANFHAILMNPRKAATYGQLAQQWRDAIQAILWNEEDGMWYDYDIRDKLHRKYFYSSNVSPLWQHAVDPNIVKANGDRILNSLKQSGGLDFPGGVPTSLIRSGEQWDFPNVWPPEVSIVVNAIENIGTPEASVLAFETAQTFVRSCHWGFQEYKQMFEKYDAENPGKFGGGGEYTVQFGFGWSNGAGLEFMKKYGEGLTADDSNDLGTTTTVSPSDNGDPSNNTA
uniref:Trehalase n=1 Tax=Spodoptera frugiperda TaxID=7108 RepID=Q0ZIF5_SPOFR|nr:trehalase [Spodoptera frugiperda]